MHFALHNPILKIVFSLFISQHLKIKRSPRSALWTNKHSHVCPLSREIRFHALTTVITATVVNVSSVADPNTMVVRKGWAATVW